MRMERNVAQQDDFVIASDFLERALQVHRRVFLIARAVLLPRAAIAGGSVDQPFALRVITGPAQQGADRFLNFVRNGELVARGFRHDMAMHDVHGLSPFCWFFAGHQWEGVGRFGGRHN